VLDAFASGFLVFAFTATALFQLALVFGAPMGEYAYGGQMPGKLPTPYRVSSLISFLLMLAIAGHYLAQLGAVPKLLSPELNQWVNWGLIGFATLAAVMNNLTRSVKERRLWGSTTIAMLIAAIIVAL
jgi:hypothetical protein